jgi:hypothetical protein
MCLAQNKTPAVYQRPDPMLKYKDGNVFDPLPKKEEVKTSENKSSNSNNNNDNNDVVLSSDVTVPKSTLTIGYTENATMV